MKWLAGVIVLFLAALLALLGGAWWLVGTEQGTHWLLERARAAIGERLQIEGAEGALAKELRIERLVFADERFRAEAHEVRVRSDLSALLEARLGIHLLTAQLITITLPPPDDKPPSLPQYIGLPIGLRVSQAHAGQVVVQRGEERHEMRNLGFRYDGGPLSHEVRNLRAELPWGGVALDAEIGTTAPFGIDGVASLSRPDPRFPVGLGVEVRGNLQRLQAALTGKLGDITGKGKAVLAPREPHWLQSVSGEVGAIDLARLDPSWPRTALSVTFNAAPRATDPLAGTLTARNAEPGSLDHDRIPVSEVSTRFATDFAAARLTELRITLSPGGVLTGSGELNAESAAFDVRAAALDLRAFRSTLRRTALSGPLRVEATAAQQSVQGTLAQEGMSLTADVQRAGDTIEIRSLHATAKGGEVSGTGRIVLGKAIAFESKLVLARFDPAQFGDYPSASINGSVRLGGRLGEPRRIDAEWTIAESLLRGQPLASRGTARVIGNDIADLNAEVRLGTSRLTAKGAMEQRASQVAWTLEAPRLAELAAQLLAQFSPSTHLSDEWSGRLRASGTLSGDLDSPKTTLAAQLDALAIPGGASVKSMSVQGTVGAGREAPFELDVTARGLAAQDVALEQVAVRTSGSLAAHDGRLNVRGNGFEIAARLRGGWSAVQGWSGEVLELRNRGTYPLELVAPVKVDFAPERIRVGRFAATLGEGRLLLREALWEDGRLASSGEFSGLPAAWLILPAGLGQQIRSTLLLDGDWSLRSTPRLNGTLTLRRASGDLIVAGTPSIDLGLQSLALNARFVEGRIAAESSVESRQGRLALRGELAPQPGAAGLGITEGSPLQFSARVEFTNMRALAQPLLTQGRVDGRFVADVRGTGTLGKPVLTGALRGESLSIEVPPYGVYLRDGQLNATLEGDRLRISELAIRGGDGRFTASGTLPLRWADGSAELAWQAKEFRVLNRPDMRLIVSGNGAAGFNGKRLALKGTLRADQGDFELEQERLPELGPDVVVLGQPRAVATKRDSRVPVALDLNLDLGDRLSLRGRGFAGQIAGRVQVVTNENGEPRAYGRIRAVDATFIAYGQRLRVDPGVLIFDGAIENPTLELTAWRRNQAVEAGIQLSGTLRAPRVQLVSQPPVAEGERLSWLVLGRAPGNASQADLSLLQAAAGALLPRGKAAPLNQRIATAFGLDELTLRGGSQVSDRVVAFGKRLSDRLYVTYEQGLGAAASNLVKLDFSLTDLVSVRAQTGTASGVGLFYRFAWD